MFNGGPGNVLTTAVFFVDSYLYMGSWSKSSLVAQAATLATFLIRINARWPLLDMLICVILNPLVLTSSVIRVIPRLRFGS